MIPYADLCTTPQHLFFFRSRKKSNLSQQKLKSEAFNAYEVCYWRCTVQVET